jgi:amino acid transporter
MATAIAAATSGPKTAKGRQMNLWSVTSLGIGAMVGAGIFAVLGQTALLAGKQTYLSFILGGCVAALCGYSYAKLSCRYPDAGGISTYFDEAFGAGRVSGTLSLIYLITIAVTIALVAKAFGAYAAPLLFGDSNRIWVDLFASGLVILMALLNMIGAGLVGKAEMFLVGFKLFILTGLMIAGAISMEHAQPVVAVAPGLTGVFAGVGLTFLAYAGFGMMANAAGSVPEPERTIPRAIYLAIAIVIVLYVCLAIVVLGNVSAAQLAQHSDTAVAEAARPVLGQAGYAIVSVAALLATASGVNAWIFSAMKISAVLAKAGQLPRMFGKALWRKGTRGLFILVVGVLLILNVFNLDALAHIASAVFLISYLAVQVAHWKLIKQTRGSHLIVATGFLAMTAVFVYFVWTTALTQPWSVALIAVFIACSAVIELLLGPKSLTAPQVKAALIR